MLRRLLMWSVVPAFVALAVACNGEPADEAGVDEAAAEADFSDIGTIRVGALPIPHNIQFIDLQRFAEPYGLDIEWVSFQRYADTQLAVSQGDVEFAAAGYHTVTLDTAPTNIDVVAGGNRGAQALVMKEGIEVEDWEDLAGLRIGTAPNSGSDIQFKLAAAAVGFDADSIERRNFTTIGPPTIVALANGEIDGMLCWEMTCAQAVHDGIGYYAPIDISENPTHSANTLAVANEAWVQDNPEAAEALVAAYVDAVEHFRNNPDEWVDAMVAATGVEEEVLRTAFETIELEWELYRDRALATADAYFEFGLSREDTTENVEQMLNYELLTGATDMEESEVGG